MTITALKGRKLFRLGFHHLERVKNLHRIDLEQGCGEVYQPKALARKYRRAAKETGWQSLFPSQKRSVDPRTGKERRHHVLQSGLQKAVKTAAKKAVLDKRVTVHTLRHYVESLLCWKVEPIFVFVKNSWETQM